MLWFICFICFLCILYGKVEIYPFYHKKLLKTHAEKSIKKFEFYKLISLLLELVCCWLFLG